MGGTFKTYLIALVVFLVMDLFWLGVVASKLYRQHLGFLMADKINWPAALLFYLVFIGGAVFFVINPALAKQSMGYALGAGAFFGFLTYATYDLTNLATLKDWPVAITVIDLIWGTVLSASVSTITYYMVNRF